MVKALNLIYTVILSNRAQDSILFHESRVYKANANQFYPILLISTCSSERDAHLLVPYMMAALSSVCRMYQVCLHVVNENVNFIEEEIEWNEEGKWGGGREEKAKRGMFSGMGDLQKRRHCFKDENKEEEKTEFLLTSASKLFIPTHRF